MRAGLLALITLGTAFSGCAQDVGVPADLAKAAINVRLLGSPSPVWQNDSFRMVLRDPVIRIAKPEPGPMGGGGAERTLNASVDFTLEAALEGGDRFPDATVRWTIYDDRFAILADQALPGDEILTVRIERHGRYQVNAVLGNRTDPEVATRRLEVVIDYGWIVESSVQPVRAPQTPASNEQGMSDRYFVPIRNRVATLDAATQFRGTWPGRNGTNVDLAAQFNATGFKCSPASSSSQRQPNPSQSRENVTVQANAQFVPIVHVGGLPAGCPNVGDYAYANAYMVPYRLFVNVTYPAYNAGALRLL